MTASNDNPVQFTYVENNDGAVITVFVRGQKPQAANSDHPNFDAILAGAFDGDPSVIDLFDVAQTVAKKFERLSDRVTVANGRLYLDGEEINNALGDQVLRFLNQGVDDWKPLVNFFENVLANPNEHSREQLYSWLVNKNITITPSGMIVGYKGVTHDNAGSYKSIHSGKALVDGVVHIGQIPNPIGSVIEMPRGEVQFDPSVGCHTGLHVGNFRYAQQFSKGAVLEVHVNPRDVVSVPTDSNAEKMRTCRYKVVGVVEEEYASLVVADYPEDAGWGDGEDEDYCSLDGCDDFGCDGSCY